MTNRHIALILTAILIVVFSFNFIPVKTDITDLSDQQFYTELIAIDGIGPTLAQRIIDYRHIKPNASPADYIAVHGIGEKKTKLFSEKFK